MDNLVVLTNFSTAADKALEYAAALARQLGAKIHLIHFWEHYILDANYFVKVPVSSAYFDNVPVASRKEHEEALQKRCARFGQDVEIAPHFIVGSTLDKLPELLKQLPGSLVIIGKCYTEDIPDEMVDSISIHLLSVKNSPFLIVPEKRDQFTLPNRIALALDGKEINQSGVVLKTIMKALKAELSIIHIASHSGETVPDKLVQVAEKFLGLVNPKIEIEAATASPVVNSIQKYCKQNQKNLLVLIHRKHSFLQSLFHEGTTGIFIRHPSIPLLILSG